jgi:predicted secreted Zn-dependent protease
VKTASPLWTLILAVLLSCCCVIWLAAVGMLGLWLMDEPISFGAMNPTSTPSATSVVSKDLDVVPTRINPNAIVVPTPTGVALKYPVTYETQFAVTTYNVQGQSLKEIHQSLEANALSDPHEIGKRFYARTDWHLSAKWFYVPTARGCEVERAQVSILVTMTLPALVTTDVVPDVQARWNTFLNNTVQHESEHVRIAYDGARNYQQQLGNYPPAVNCTAIQPQLQNLFRQHYDLIDRTNVEYDRKTQHGAAQGAVFP